MFKIKYSRANNSLKQHLLVVYEDKQIKESILCVDVNVISMDRPSPPTEHASTFDKNEQQDKLIESFSLALGFKRGYLKLLHYKYKDSGLRRKIRTHLLR